MDVLKSFLTGTVVVKVGDITKENVDAIVNAANGTLHGWGWSRWGDSSGGWAGDIEGVQGDSTGSLSRWFADGTGGDHDGGEDAGQARHSYRGTCVWAGREG